MINLSSKNGDLYATSCHVSKSKSLRNSLLAFINSPLISVSAISARTLNGLKTREINMAKGNNNKLLVRKEKAITRNLVNSN